MQDLRKNKFFVTQYSPEWNCIGQEEKDTDGLWYIEIQAREWSKEKKEYQKINTHVYIFGEKRLGIYTDNRGIKTVLKDKYGCKVEQSCDGEWTLSFDWTDENIKKIGYFLHLPAKL